MSWPWTALAYEAGLCSTHLTLSRDYSGGPSINGASLVKVGLAPKQQRPALMEYMEKYAGIVHGQDHGRVRWKSTWWRVKTHKGPPCSACRRSSHDVDAAGCKSVGDDGGTWDIFTNCHLFVCKRISAIYRPSVCCPRYSGEYRINCISLLILSILQVSGPTY